MNEYIRYKAAATLIENGQIKKIEDIFKMTSKTNVLRVLRINFDRFNRALRNPENFRIKELIALANILKVNPKFLVDMAYNQSVARKRGRPRKTNN